MSNAAIKTSIQYFFLFLFAVLATPYIWGFAFSSLEEQSVMKVNVPLEFPALEGISDHIMFLNNLGNYINSRPPLPKTTKTIYARILLGLKQADLGEIILGKNGWIFMNGPFYKNSYQYADSSSGNIDKVYNSMLILDKFAEENGAELVVLIVPNKASIYPEYLPSYYTNAPKIYPTSLADSLVSLNEKRGNPFILLHPKDDLLNNKSEKEIQYYKTDSHWTVPGALVGLENIIEAINDPNQLNHWENLRVEYSNETTFIGGKMGITGRTETEAKYTPVGFGAEELKAAKNDWCPGYEKFSQSGTDLPNIIFIHDSYGNEIRNVYPYYFGETQKFHFNKCKNVGDYLSAAAAETELDYVVVITIERFLTENSWVLSSTANQLDSLK